MPRKEHIDSPVLSRRSAESYGHRYTMHRYWSKKSPDVVATFIEHYTKKGDIVLDPFAGSGVVACEAARLGRRALAIDLNPMATFIAKATLTPVPLFRLDWAFQDVAQFCESRVAELYETRCAACGKRAEIELVKREDERPTRIAYLCQCSKKRLFKDPTRSDLRLERSFEKHSIPFWYPDGHPLPRIQNERHQFVHELFTRRNLICLSTILHAIDKTEDPKCRELLRLSFTACLDKCSRLKPITPPDTDRPSLSMGWTAVRFYAPRVCGEVNPWHAFSRAFREVRKGKQESNRVIRDVTLGETPEDLFSGSADVVVATGSAEAVLAAGGVPDDGVSYVLTDPPYADRIQYLALSTLWGAWLKHDFDYDSEVVVARLRGKTEDDYWGRMAAVLAECARVLQEGSPAHFFFHDVRGQHFHRFVTALAESQFAPQRVIYQPVVKSFSHSARTDVTKTSKRGGHVGDYVVRTELASAAPVLCGGTPSRGLRRKVANLARRALQIHGGRARLQSLMHAVYQGLDEACIVEFASQNPDDLVRNVLRGFASMDASWATLQGSEDNNAGTLDLRGMLRQALLDAYSMLPPELDNKYPAWQFVFRRFEDERITFDDVREVDAKIKEEDTNRHRRDRYRRILELAGEALGFQFRKSGQRGDRVTWREGKQVVCEWVGLGNREIEVQKPIDGRKRDGQPSVMQYADLEQGLWDLGDNRAKFRELRHLLNPMDLYGEHSGEPKAHGAADATMMRWRVLRNDLVCSDHYMMELDVGLPREVGLKPGQFFHILCETPGETKRRRMATATEPDLTLRRPLSAHRIHYSGFDRSVLAKPSQLPPELRDRIEREVSQIDFLYKVVGKGTARLSRLKPGDALDVIGPIGRGFSVRRTDRRAVIVAGGVGIAPLVALAEWLRYRDVDLRVYLGALRQEHLQMALRPDSRVDLGFADGSPGFADVVRREFSEIGVDRVVVCTDDGSVGEKGRVTDILARDVKASRLWRTDVSFYACGPKPMMQGVSEIAASLDARCEVLMEERMGCGVGACYSCVCKVADERGKTEMKRVCVDGPVFDGEKVRWKT